MGRSDYELSYDGQVPHIVLTGTQMPEATVKYTLTRGGASAFFDGRVITDTGYWYHGSLEATMVAQCVVQYGYNNNGAFMLRVQSKDGKLDETFLWLNRENRWENADQTAEFSIKGTDGAK